MSNCHHEMHSKLRKGLLQYLKINKYAVPQFKAFFKKGHFLQGQQQKTQKSQPNSNADLSEDPSLWGKESIF